MFIEIDEGVDFYKSALRTIENDPYYLDIFNNFMNIAEVNYIRNKNVEELRQLIRNKKYVAIKYYKGDSLKTLQVSSHFPLLSCCYDYILDFDIF